MKLSTRTWLQIIWPFFSLTFCNENCLEMNVKAEKKRSSNSVQPVFPLSSAKLNQTGLDAPEVNIIHPLVRWAFSALAFLCLTLNAQAPAQRPANPPTTPTIQPALEPGEGLALVGPDGQVAGFGDSKKEYPMGSLAKLLWLRLDGRDWAARGGEFKCTGSAFGYRCWKANGHGRVDLEKALQESCNLAFLAWANLSTERWKEDIGESAARYRLEEVFRPFLGNRLPVGDTLPQLTPAWVGDGTLLWTSVESMAAWLADYAQEDVRNFCKRFLGSFFKNDQWWYKTGTAPVPGEAAATSAWVAGSNGKVIAVLHLPRGRGRAEGISRFKAILGIK